MAEGIPTTYKGVRFRSRLEARWAAFFDSVAWQWSYEPFDLNGYIPDFVLAMNPPLLVEVKPETEYSGLEKSEAKIERSGWEGDALLVGATIWDVDHVHPVIGVFGEFRSVFEWGEARVILCISCGSLVPLPADGSWICRSCGLALRHGDMGMTSLIVEAWSHAGNRVQWRAA